MRPPRRSSRTLDSAAGRSCCSRLRGLRSPPRICRKDLWDVCGTFVPRLVALTVVWLLATAALTYAAAQKISTAPPTTPAGRRRRLQLPAGPPDGPGRPPPGRTSSPRARSATPASPGSVTGSVRGYASNTVAAQTPAPGTQVIDTGAPTIVLRLARSGAQLGIPERGSAIAGTRVRLAALASDEVKVPAHARRRRCRSRTVVKHRSKKAVPVTKTALGTKAAPVKKAAARSRAWPPIVRPRSSFRARTASRSPSRR